MAKRVLGPAALAVGQAVAAALPDRDFVVGCSGGADSMALALGAQWASKLGPGFFALVVDHGLQPGSATLARSVVEQLASRGIEAKSVRVQVGQTGEGLEAAARAARLAALEESGRPVLLGHTADDQAETVLLGLARGSGARSLAGMAPVRGPFVRPLLRLSRQLTEQACREWGVPVWDDPHNADERFTRVRVRRKVLPVLEAELGPGVREALVRTAQLCRADADALEALTPATSEMYTAWLQGLDPAIRASTIGAWLREVSADVSSGHIAQVTELVTSWRGQKGVDVVGGRVVRRDGRLHFVAR